MPNKNINKGNPPSNINYPNPRTLHRFPHSVHQFTPATTKVGIQAIKLHPQKNCSHWTSNVRLLLTAPSTIPLKTVHLNSSRLLLRWALKLIKLQRVSPLAWTASVASNSSSSFCVFLSTLVQLNLDFGWASALVQQLILTLSFSL